MNPKGLLLIGPLPEPRGGISVHLERLGRLASGFINVSFVDESRCRKPGVFNLRSLNVFKYLAVVKRADIVHVHSGRPLLRAFHVACARLLRRRTIATIHGSTFMGKAGVFLDKAAMRWAHQVVVVDKKTSERLGQNKNILIQHGFIPPEVDLEPVLPQELMQWIEAQRCRGRKIFVANAWRLDRYRGHDLYGADLCLELAIRLRESGEAAALLFAVSSSERQGRRLERLRDRIDQSGLHDCFRFWQGSLSFPRLILEADCVLRPTRADGDSLTVREALSLGRPVIASDVVSRPEGTTLFKNGDSNDLQAQALAVIHGEITWKTPCPNFDPMLFYHRLYAASEK